MRTHPSHINLIAVLAGLSLHALSGLAILHPSVIRAANRPDVVWQTNAHNMYVSAVALSTDGTLLVSASPSDGLKGYIKFWRVTDRALVRTIELGHEEVFALAISADGNYLAS